LETQKTVNTPKAILNKKSSTVCIATPDFKLYYYVFRAIAIKMPGTGTKADKKTIGTE
jgi:hypothetical protein